MNTTPSGTLATLANNASTEQKKRGRPKGSTNAKKVQQESRSQKNQKIALPARNRKKPEHFSQTSFSVGTSNNNNKVTKPRGPKATPKTKPTRGRPPSKSKASSLQAEVDKIVDDAMVALKKRLLKAFKDHEH